MSVVLEEVSDQLTLKVFSSEVDPCDQPKDGGTGGEGLPRWYFDKRENKCMPFTYGGLSGNENNFISQSNCLRQCPGEYRSIA